MARVAAAPVYKEQEAAAATEVIVACCLATNNIFEFHAVKYSAEARPVPLHLCWRSLDSFGPLRGMIHDGEPRAAVASPSLMDHN